MERSTKEEVGQVDKFEVERLKEDAARHPRESAAPQPYLFKRPAHILAVWSLLLVSALGVVIYAMVHQELLGRVLELVAF